MLANSESEGRKGKTPTSCCWSCLKSCPTTFDSRAFKVSQSSPCFHICFYARAAPKGDCFHSFSFMSCSPPCTPEERVWIPTLIPTTVFSRFLFIKIRQKPNTDGEKEPHLTGGLDSPVTGVCECRSDVGVAESSLWRRGSGLGQQEAQRGDG